MTTLVIGGSGSGKSEYGENLIVSLGQRKRIYIATMKPWDEECEKRIERHRLMRAKKHFETMECYEGLRKLCLNLKERPAAVLLECMSNLVSNEQFGLSEKAERLPGREDVKEEVIQGVLCLREQAEDVVIVTNEVFSDGDNYSEQTNEYRSLLGEINQEIAAIADRVVEVVAGIPIVLK